MRSAIGPRGWAGIIGADLMEQARRVGRGAGADAERHLALAAPAVGLEAGHRPVADQHRLHLLADGIVDARRRSSRRRW